ncbi:MAG TPA: ATP-binding protein [Candidatus Dormibacteraeota bacterium]|nr:ATP-binding protein [Candidatus Dormibacteraeota bacterium]
MRQGADRQDLAWSLLVSAAGIAALMLGFELTKQSLFPKISIWNSHVATICFTTAIATVAAYLVRLRLARLNRKLENDFHELERMADALRHSEGRYRSLFEGSKAGVFVSLPEGRLVECNETFAQMFGYTREELYTLPTSVLYPGGKPEREARIAELKEKGQLRDYEICYRRKDGGLAWAIQNVTLVKDVGGSDVIEGTIVDITDRHLLDERLRQSQKMEAVGQLAGGVAHDFNNLLTVIQGYGRLLKDRLQDGEAQKHLGQIEVASDRAASLTRQLLAFSRKQVLQPKVVNLNTLVANIGQMLHRLIGENIELVTKLSGDLALVKVDFGQIEQVIVNLALNARDAMPNGGKLTIETVNVDLDRSYAEKHVGVTPGSYVMLAVSDTGTGMSPETQARIFEPFFTTKEMGRGTGLGLSIVYGIVKQSGGNIWIYSELGHGTSFKIYFPQCTKEKEVESVPAETPVKSSAPNHQTILVVEDDDEVRELVKAVLEGLGYAVLVADGAQSATSIAEKHAATIHLLLTDVIMPGMNGHELAKRLVERNPRIKVLYMSGYTANSIGPPDMPSASVSFLEKPFTPSTLARKVRTVLESAQ